MKAAIATTIAAGSLTLGILATAITFMAAGLLFVGASLLPVLDLPKTLRARKA